MQKKKDPCNIIVPLPLEAVIHKETRLTDICCTKWAIENSNPPPLPSPNNTALIGSIQSLTTRAEKRQGCHFHDLVNW